MRYRSAFGFRDDELLLIYVGRLSPEKNIPFLLKSFNGAVQAYPTLGLLLVGDGPECDNLHDLVSYMGLNNRVKFTGIVDYKNLPSYLKLADIFVTSSMAETFGLSVVEAIASGLPVLGINTTGICDNIEDGVTGFLAPEDQASFTAKMVRLITDRDLRLKMGVQARLASEAFAIDKTVLLILEQYRRLLNQATHKNRGLNGLLQRLFATQKNSQS
jgi:1,2-diacylglycerol 3-alpha-glucosyltransferase